MRETLMWFTSVFFSVCFSMILLNPHQKCIAERFKSIQDGKCSDQTKRNNARFNSLSTFGNNLEKRVSVLEAINKHNATWAPAMATRSELRDLEKKLTSGPRLIAKRKSRKVCLNAPPPPVKDPRPCHCKGLCSHAVLVDCYWDRHWGNPFSKKFRTNGWDDEYEVVLVEEGKQDLFLFNAVNHTTDLKAGKKTENCGGHRDGEECNCVRLVGDLYSGPLSVMSGALNCLPHVKSKLAGETNNTRGDKNPLMACGKGTTDDHTDCSHEKDKESAARNNARSGEMYYDTKRNIICFR